MKKTIFIIALVVFWLALVIRNIPAQWGFWLANSPLQVEGISGTLWSGSASNVVLPFQSQHYALGELQWKLRPLSLLVLNPCLELSSEYQNQSLSGEACVGLGGSAEFNNVVVKLPANAAKLWLPIADVKGDLLFRIDHLKTDDSGVQSLSGKGRWDDAYYFTGVDWIKLGAIAFDFRESPDKGVITEVLDVEGPLQLNLLYQFSMQGTFDLKGDIVLRPTAPKEIAQMLSFIAEKKGDNHFYVEWGGG